MHSHKIQFLIIKMFHVNQAQVAVLTYLSAQKQIAAVNLVLNSLP